MRKLYPFDYKNPYGMKYRIYLTQQDIDLVCPQLKNYEEEDSWYNCEHDKRKGMRRDTPRDLNSEEEIFAIDEGYRLIENPKYNPPNRNCKQCNK